MRNLRVKGRAIAALAACLLSGGLTSAWSADVLLSKAFPQGRTADSHVIQLDPKDVLVFDAPPTGSYVLHGRRLVIVATRARVDSAVTISAFDDTDTPEVYANVAPKGADGPNGVGETNFEGNPASNGLPPTPLVALQGKQGADAREIVLDIGALTGSGKLTINGAGARGGKGQTGGKGGTGGQGGRGHDGSDGGGFCKESGGKGGQPGIGGPGGTGGTGGTGGRGATIILSEALFGPPTSSNLLLVIAGGQAGGPGEPGVHGDGGQSAEGGSGSKFCDGGGASGVGANGPEGARGSDGANGQTGAVVLSPS